MKSGYGCPQATSVSGLVRLHEGEGVALTDLGNLLVDWLRWMFALLGSVCLVMCCECDMGEDLTAKIW